MNPLYDHHYLTTHAPDELARCFHLSVLSDTAVDNADRCEFGRFRKLIAAALLARTRVGGAV